MPKRARGLYPTPRSSQAPFRTLTWQPERIRPRNDAVARGPNACFSTYRRTYEPSWPFHSMANHRASLDAEICEAISALRASLESGQLDDVDAATLGPEYAPLESAARVVRITLNDWEHLTSLPATRRREPSVRIWRESVFEEITMLSRCLAKLTSMRKP